MEKDEEIREKRVMHKENLSMDGWMDGRVGGRMPG